ncbi:hypothetical protein DPMN_054381 [Dreissena polymorpha]|uniref:Uncharacterized protein n=1 Tax=Dreissena polymorpha TaxID=45954 RepID=A0A9D4HRK6_DREPO|nr:hypothetical protein DPMN_054381 [Dreissena polymorpha]
MHTCHSLMQCLNREPISPITYLLPPVIDIHHLSTPPPIDPHSHPQATPTTNAPTPSPLKLGLKWPPPTIYQLLQNIVPFFYWTQCYNKPPCCRCCQYFITNLLPTLIASHT